MQLVEVGSLTRELGASAMLAIENELDWEHLPHIHASTFSAISLIRSDRNGWEADVVLANGAPIRMVVMLDEDRLGYSNGTFSGDVEVARAVARIEVVSSETCRINMRFLAPPAPEAELAAAGSFFETLYKQILDEDEPKMQHHARALREGPAARLRRRSVTLSNGQTYQAPEVCPHQGLPLSSEPDAFGIMTCPWHGYRFDVRTGKCIHGTCKGWD